VRRSALLCICVIAIFWMPRLAGAPSGEPATYNFKIDGQPLGTALQEFAKQSGVQIIFFSQVTEGIKAPTLSGTYTIAGALQILLAGSHLTFRVINPKTIEIRPSSAVDPLDETRRHSTTGGKPEGGATRTAEHSQIQPLRISAPLDEIVVTGFAEGLVATRTETPLREIPQTVSIISQEQIRQENYIDLGDALAGAIGITSQRTDSLSQNFFARGFQITTFHLDGGAALNSFDLTAEPFFGAPALGEFDRLEVLRGADGLFGGNGNPGATVNLVRKRPLSETEVMFNVSGGSWNNYRAEIDVTGPLAFHGALRGRMDFDLADCRYFYETANLKRGKLFGALEYDLTLNTLVTVGGSYERVDSLPMVSGLPRYFNGVDPHLPRSTGLTFNWASYDTKTREIYFQLAQAFNAAWKLKINATSWDENASYDYGDFGSDFLPISSGVLPISPFYVYSARPNTLNQLAVDATLTGRVEVFGHRIDVAIGADLLRFRGSTASVNFYNPDDAVSNAYAYSSSTYPDPRLSRVTAEEDDARVSSDQGAAFGSAKVYFNDALSLVAGGRVSRDSASTHGLNRLGSLSVSGSHGFKTPTKATPYAGLVYDLDRHYSLYASYADIYQSNGLIRTKDGSFLPPIDGINVEVGLKSAWHDGLLNGTLALYGSEQRGLPLEDRVADATSAGYLYGCCSISGGIFRSKGIDSELSGRLAPGWLIGAGYTYNVNYGFRDGALSAATPRHLFKLWTSLRLRGNLQRWTVGGNVHAQSSSGENYNECPFDAQANCVGPFNTLFRTVQGPYVVVGLRAGYDIDSHWRAALNMNNVFDRIYYQAVGTASGGSWYGEPRNLMVRIDAKY
jgi:outer-membrane receptor for ferric coprogen and ferric-rhodotorulic acid